MAASPYLFKYRRWANVPYGWCYDAGLDRVVKYTPEQTLIGLIIEMRSDGLGYRRITNILNRVPIRTRSGGRWFPEQVKRILVRYSMSEE